MNDRDIPFEHRALHRAQRSEQNKRAALIAAASYAANTDTLSSRDVMDIAEKFLTWLEQT